ncbi:MAG: hypothetical protein KDE20_10505 [Caldilineaceae bacterium]|nr:hypothetical protein [Caldilineaceae bacterium]MCB0159207.1 hypothetical protein [Caldilineaceae bacterium]
MTRRQFDRYLTIHIIARVLLILAVAVLLALLYLSVTRLDAAAAPIRPPRTPQQQEQRLAPRPAPPACIMSRYAQPGNCNPERRPHDRSVPR